MNHFDVNAISQFFYASSTCLLSLMVIVYVRNRLAEITNNFAYAVLGIVGVPLHETSHLVIALLVNHKIIDFQLFKPSSDGSLGYVLHSYRPSILSPISNLLIGIAPLFGGTFAFVMVTKWLQPELFDYFTTHIVLSNLLNGDLSGVFSKITHMLDVILFSSTNSYVMALWLFLSYSIIVYSVPSKADLSQSRIGLLLMMGLILLLSAFMPSALVWVSIRISALNSVWLSIAMLHVIIFCLTLAITSLLKRLKPTPQIS
ncbi:MAG: hypothetical protein V7749_00185 [Cocleimonas sp.]|jgi:hypothetical protein